MYFKKVMKNQKLEHAIYSVIKNNELIATYYIAYDELDIWKAQLHVDDLKDILKNRDLLKKQLDEKNKKK